MRLDKLIKRYEYRCKTCNINININEALGYEHLDHDIRANERLKYFLLDIGINIGICVSVSLLAIYFFILPQLEKIIAICNSAIGIGSV